MSERWTSHDRGVLALALVSVCVLLGMFSAVMAPGERAVLAALVTVSLAAAGALALGRRAAVPPAPRIAPTPADGVPAGMRALAARLDEARLSREGARVLLEGRLRGERVRVSAVGPAFLVATCPVEREVPPHHVARLERGPEGARLLGGAPLPAGLAGPGLREALDVALRARFRVDIAPHGVSTQVVNLSRQELERALDELVSLAGALDGTRPLAAEARPQAAAADTCPYSRSAVDDVDAACAGCGTVHHAGCFEEHGRCTVAGCASTRARSGRARRAEGAS